MPKTSVRRRRHRLQCLLGLRDCSACSAALGNTLQLKELVVTAGQDKVLELPSRLIPGAATGPGRLSDALPLNSDCMMRPHNVRRSTRFWKFHQIADGYYMTMVRCWT